MTLPRDAKKLSKEEEQSIENAVKDAGIKAVHPDKMEALAESMVEKLSIEQ